MYKKNVLVAMGGTSTEREVSMSTGKMIKASLDSEKYNIRIVEIDKDGRWLLETNLLDGVATAFEEIAIESLFNKLSIDVVFIALHGKYGEDGTVQGMLEFFKIPYTGSGVLASALAMDKIRSRQLFQANGIKVPKYIMQYKNVLREGSAINDFSELVSKQIGLPCVVKPNDGGSSIGVFIVDNKEQLKNAIVKVFEFSNIIVVEEYIKGIEITVGVFDDLDKDIPISFPVIEIVPQNGWFDYDSKYIVGGAEEIIPARIDKHFTEMAKEIGIKAHLLLGCKGLSRTDMIIKDDTIYTLETNTLPGMTETSLYPQAAKVIGIDFPTLLDKLIEIAINK